MAEISLRTTAIIACRQLRKRGLHIPENRVANVMHNISKFTTTNGQIRSDKLSIVASIFNKEAPRVTAEITKGIETQLRDYGLVSSADSSSDGNGNAKIIEIMRKLVSAKDTDGIWAVFGDIAKESGIGSGGAVYEINERLEIRGRGRFGLVGSTRYSDWTVPKGEKAQIIDIYNFVAQNCKKTNGGATEKDTSMLKSLRFWRIKNREEWPEYGLNRQILSKIKDERTLREAFMDEGRIQASRIFLESCGMSELSRIINANDELSFSIFKQTVCNYIDALEDIELDKKRLNLTAEEGTPKPIRQNFNYLVTDASDKLIAVAFANNHEESIKTGMRPLEEENGENVLRAVDNTLSLALASRMDQRQLKLDKKQTEQLLKLSKTVISDSIAFEERLIQAVKILQYLFKTNGEEIRSSLMRVDPHDPTEMAIVATTVNPDPQKLEDPDHQTLVSGGIPRMLVSGRIPVDGKPAKISAWVAQLKKDVLVFGGKIFVGGEELTEKELEELKSNEKLFLQLKRVTDNKLDTFMCVPLISEDELLGVVNVRGARLTDKDMQILKSASVILSLAIRITIQATTDALTRLYNRLYFEEAIKSDFAGAKTKNLALSCVAMDLIGFKDTNDRADHPTGDYVLQYFAKKLRTFAKDELKLLIPQITIARLGGDEFGLLLPDTDMDGAERFTKKFQNYLTEHPVSFDLGPFAGQSRIIYFRAGISAYNDRNSGNLFFRVQSATDLAHSADKAERLAKEQGGDPIRRAL